MPAEKRKRIDASEGSSDRPIIIDESDHEVPIGSAEVDRPSKKRKIVQQSSQRGSVFSTPATLFSFTPSPIPSEPLESLESPVVRRTPTAPTTSRESEDPWGTDRGGFRKAMLALCEKYTTSADGSIANALVHLSRGVTDLESNPGRSPAYKMEQLKKVGKSPLLNLPGEIRIVIWKFANPPKVSCCFTGTRTHDGRESVFYAQQDAHSALIRALIGRGIPVSRQILWETRGVASSVGLRFCSVWCASVFVRQIRSSFRPPVSPESWERGRPWRNIQKLEVDMESEINR